MLVFASLPNLTVQLRKREVKSKKFQKFSRGLRPRFYILYTGNRYDAFDQNRFKEIPNRLKCSFLCASCKGCLISASRRPRFAVRFRLGLRFRLRLRFGLLMAR